MHILTLATALKSDSKAGAAIDDAYPSSKLGFEVVCTLKWQAKLLNTTMYIALIQINDSLLAAVARLSSDCR